MDHVGLSNSYELLIKIQKVLKKILRADPDVLKRKVPKMVISKKKKFDDSIFKTFENLPKKENSLLWNFHKEYFPFRKVSKSLKNAIFKISFFENDHFWTLPF